MQQALLLADGILLFVVVIAAAVVDARVRRIPNVLVACGAAGKLLLLVGEGLLAGDGAREIGLDLGLALVGAVGIALFMLIMYWLPGRKADAQGAGGAESAQGRPLIGGGDIKLMATVALWFDFKKAMIILALSCVFALVVALIRNRGKLEPAASFPFAPYIAVATAVVFLGTLL